MLQDTVMLKSEAQNLTVCHNLVLHTKKFSKFHLTKSYDSPILNYCLNILILLTCITAKKIAKEESNAQLPAEIFPNFWAAKLIFCARGKPISLKRLEKLLFIASSSFLVSIAILFANFALRMLSTTLIVKSKSTLSILCNALNHAPERIALVFRFTSCFLLRKQKAQPLGTALNIMFPFSSCFLITLLMNIYELCSWIEIENIHN